MTQHGVPLADVEFVAFDLETTGLFPISCRIVEFGAVRFTLAAGELETFEQIIDPECPIPAEATGVHGITDQMVRGMPTVAEALPRFLGFLVGSDAVLMAHNASFDIGFVGLAMAKLGIPFPTNPVIDTLDVSRKYVPELGSHRLEEVARYLRVADSEDHRGLSDSRLAMGVFERIVDRSARLKTVDDLFHVSPPLSFTDSGSLVLEPPAGYEELGAAIREEKTVVVTYDGAVTGPVERRITPRGLIQSRGQAYLTALCHISGTEKTYRLDRIRQLWIEE
jgi:DNA polymerase III epsilon subunit family exonuclease